MIRLSGQEPGVDIAIDIVGRRPGEKLHEELFNRDERPQPTPAEKIVAAVRPQLSPDWVEEAFIRVEELVYNGDPSALAKTVASLARERALVASTAEPLQETTGTEATKLL
jgi:FlaA1/EpsC-like NDP-sugar epimerase